MADAGRYFELERGSSKKFWSVRRTGAAVTVRFGRIGTGGQEKTKNLAGVAAATQEVAKLIREKLSKGYVERKAASAANTARRARSARTVPPAGTKTDSRIAQFRREALSQLQRLCAKVPGCDELYPLLATSSRLAVGFRSVRGGDNASTSRLGGNPNLPRDVAWPRDPDEPALPLWFLLQIRLSEMPRGAASELPPRGMLYFFIDFDSERRPWETARVLFSPVETGLVATPMPEDLKIALATAAFRRDNKGRRTVTLPEDLRTLLRGTGGRVCRLKARPMLALPMSDSPEYEPIGAVVDRDPKLEDRFWNLLEKFDKQQGYPPAHRLLGHPHLVQDNMVTNLEKSLRTPWRLLLQLDSDHTANQVWGDMGSLYFWIPEPDLKKLRFDRVRCVYQSC
jgi:predicted DNA-binding WGR domain protein